MKPDEAALCDLLEVTRRVMLPAKDNGTFWCEGVNPLRMCEWALSVRAQTAAPGSHDVLEPTAVAPPPSPCPDTAPNAPVGRRCTGTVA